MMAWEHDIAREFKKRNNPQNYAYFTGEVLSPVAVRLPNGTVIYQGPTIISCFDGAIMLREDRLLQVPKGDGTPYCAGETVALLGHPFDRQAGGQKILIAGVAEHVV